MTSRAPLEDLAVDGAALHQLSALPYQAAVDLLIWCSGTNPALADVAAASRIVQTCAHNPLAVRTTAARLILRPG
ncbi:hypothetical protein ACFXI8_26780 [Streptomyces niveus]|uniref:hypothetical protein n=1 Tax=Streptomyces niveus TaxID=193462 RepID=UPI0036A75B08